MAFAVSDYEQRFIPFPPLIQAASIRWLKTFEVLQILQHSKTCLVPFRKEAVSSPSSGTLHLFHKKYTKYKRDGVNWKKKKCDKIVQENHETLKVGGVPAVKCIYTRSIDDDKFCRRCYSLIQNEDTPLFDKNIVLVHYLRVKESPKRKISEERTFKEPRKKHRKPNGASPLSPSLSLLEPTENVSCNSNVDAIPLPPPIEQFLEFVAVHPRNEEQPYYHTDPVIPESVRSLPQLPFQYIQPEPALIHLAEYAPKWDWVEGGSAILLIFPQQLSSPYLFSASFNGILVPGQFITGTALRCEVPPHPAGRVSLCVFWNEIHLLTHSVAFEYKDKYSSFNS